VREERVDDGAMSLIVVRREPHARRAHRAQHSTRHRALALCDPRLANHVAPTVAGPAGVRTIVVHNVHDYAPRRASVFLHPRQISRILYRRYRAHDFQLVCVEAGLA
jgi:hypothetical protein